MNKQQKLKIALPILVVVMAFVWGPVIMGSGSKKKADQNQNTGSIVATSQGDSVNMDLAALSRAGIRQKTRSSYADWGRNPFARTQGPRALILEGIVWDEKSPKAIINGNIIGIGDNIDSNVVVDIKQDSVMIKGEAGEIELRLGMGE